MAETEAHEAQPTESGENEYAQLADQVESEGSPDMFDLATPEITQALTEAPLFLKSAVVEAHVAEAGERVVTTLADGREETAQTTEGGEYVVTNPSGEQYVLQSDNFAKRYEEQEDGTFRAKGACRAVPNPTGEDITIMAPWGEEQHGGADCMIAVAVDPTEPDAPISDDRYIIGGAEFAQTYAPSEQLQQ